MNSYDYHIIKSELDENSIILICNKTKKAALIDPSNEKGIIQKIEETKLIPKKILLTHGHYDHILAVNSLKYRYNIPVVCHKDEVEYLKDPMKNLSKNISITPDMIISNNEEIQIGELKIRTIHTPGHTKGSVSYYLTNLLISGDTLFKESIGRTDLYGGSLQSILNSIKILISLPEETIVIPGHGENTTIKHERKNNPFV
jgi:glyoxylase-like metal-dependent hydrolase (beta-lactamase superfamily II)